MDTFKYFVSKLIPAGAIFIFTKLAFDSLGSEAYGEYSLIFAQASLIVSFCAGFFKQILLKFHVSNKKLADDIAYFSYALVLVVIVPSCIISYVNDSSFLWLYIFSVCLSVQLLYLTFCQVQMKTSDYMKSELIRSVFMILSAFIVYQFDLNLFFLLGFVSLSYLTSSNLLKLFVLKVALKRWGSYFNKKTLSYALPVSLWLGMQALFPLIERGSINSNFSTSILGSYSLVSEYAIRVFGLLLMPFTLSIHPKVMIYFDQGDYNKLNNCIVKTLFIQLLLSITYITGVYFFAVYFFSFIISDLNMAVVNIAWAFALSGAIWQMSLITQKYLEASGNTLLMMFFMVLSLGVYIFFTKVWVMSNSLSYFVFIQAACATIYFVLTLLYGLFFMRKSIRNDIV
jgi:O-antigen/teichoic acid export membrane protein